MYFSFRVFYFAVAVFAMMPGITSSAGADETLPRSNQQIQLSFAPLVKKSAPAVVNIYSSKTVRSRRVTRLFNDPFFSRFFGNDLLFGSRVPRNRVQNSLGSGVIVKANGLIVTNNHVVDGADQITVVLADRREFGAVIVGVDEKTDLAILRIDTGGETLPFLEFRDSDQLEVGDLVLAIGNPFGVGQTVTSGIVSALARTRVGVANLGSFIQTDAAINPGNSGGALIGMDGLLAGINTAIFSKSGGSLGIGFATPSNLVRSVVEGVLKEGRLIRPWLGAWGQPVSSDIAASVSLSRPSGVLINKIYPHGPAARAGLRIGDVLLGVGGREVNDPQALKFRISTLPVSGEIELTIWRKGKNRQLRLGLEAPKEDPPRDVSELDGQQPLSGGVVANMSPALADEMGIDSFDPGVVMLRMRRGSPANRFGFRGGDRLLEINGEKVVSVSSLKSLLRKRVSRWAISISRNGKTMSLAINR